MSSRSFRRLLGLHLTTMLTASAFVCVLDGCKKQAPQAGLQATEASAAGVLGHLSLGHGDMVQVDAGVFQMGSAAGEGDADEQRHEVTVSKPFLLDKTEVTAGAYAACVKAGRCAASSTTWWGGQQHTERGAENPEKLFIGRTIHRRSG